MKTLFIGILGRMAYGGNRNSYFNFYVEDINRTKDKQAELYQIIYDRDLGEPVQAFEVPMTEPTTYVPELRYGDIIMVQDIVNNRIYAFEYIGNKRFTKVKVGK